MRHTAALTLGSGLIGAVVAALISALMLSGSDESNDGDLQSAIADAVQSAMAETVADVIDERLQRSDDQAAARLAEAMASQRTLVASAFEAVAPSVVLIDAEGPERVNEEGVAVVSAALATGFLLDDQGHVVTAAHVLDGMTSVTVVLPSGDRREAQQIGDDRPFSDVGVLRFQPEASDELAVPTFGEDRRVDFGETVLAIGNTLMGSDLAVTVGVVSDPDTTFFRERYEQVQLIQTDAALNHGNSGGVLVDLDGVIVGMPAVIARATHEGGFVDGVGFALQIVPVLEIARTIAAEGFYPRASFGVVDERLLNPTAAAQLDLGVSEGSFLIELERQGAFARAGIRPGDVLRRLNDTPINAETPYLNAMASLEPLVPAAVHIYRGDQEYRLLVTPDLREP